MQLSVSLRNHIKACRLLTVLVTCALLVSTSFARCKPTRIMGWQEYSRLHPNWPYVVRINSPRTKLVYYGASHTYSPDDPQLIEIEKLWVEFHPELAFNEGGNPPIEKSRDDAVKKYGEPGLIRFLAHRDHVPVTSIDQSRAEEVAFLLKRFSPERVKLFFILRVVAQQIQNHPNDSLEDELKRVFAIFNDTPGLNVTPASIVELETSYTRTFPNGGDYKKASLSWFDPVKSENFLNEISRQLNIYRDQYMVALIARHVMEGQRVFAVVGGTHVVMQESALRKLLRN